MEQIMAKRWSKREINAEKWIYDCWQTPSEDEAKRMYKERFESNSRRLDKAESQRNKFHNTWNNLKHQTGRRFGVSCYNSGGNDDDNDYGTYDDGGYDNGGY